MLKLWLVFLAFLPVWGQANTAVPDIPNRIVLATTDWCPYACSNSDTSPGIAYEYVKAVLKKNGIDAHIEFYPWTRAIKEVRSCRAHGLLTAVREEAPYLNFTHTPTMAYRVCFFTQASNDWVFQGIQSLKQVTLGAIRGYGYDPQLDEYIRDPNSQGSLQLISGGDEILRFINMLSLKRIDTFLDDQYVAAWQAKSNKVDFSEVRKAGCLADNPFYLALNPALEWGDKLIELLDGAFLKKENKALLNTILKKYTAQD